MTERARLTWDSLAATALSARDILRSKLLAVIWRLRGLAATVLVLWTAGLVAGAIHPVGYLGAVLITSAFCWMYLTCGLLTSVRAPVLAHATNPSFLFYFLLTGSFALPYLLPARYNSVLWSVGSAPFVDHLALLSYRDLRSGLAYQAQPFLQSIGVNTGESAMRVMLTCLAAIVLPTLAGIWCWRYSVANFDRLIGRPRKDEAQIALEQRVTLTTASFAQLPRTAEPA